MAGIFSRAFATFLASMAPLFRLQAPLPSFCLARADTSVLSF